MSSSKGRRPAEPERQQMSTPSHSFAWIAFEGRLGARSTLSHNLPRFISWSSSAMTEQAGLALTQIPVGWDEAQVESAVAAAIESGSTKVKKSSMKLGPYNGFSGEMRVVADRKIKVAIELGLVPKPSACSVCGKSEGRIDYHAEDYGNPFQVAAICQGCHMKLHNRHRSPGFAASWRSLVERHGDGQKWFDKLA